jgi:hypothetical protein
VSVAHYAGDHLPVGPSVNPDAHPAFATDVRRPEKAHRVLLDERLLQPRRDREPDRDMVGPVMMRVHLGEDLPDPPRELAPSDRLGDPGKRQTDASQALNCAVFGFRMRSLERVRTGVGRRIG